MFNSLEDMKLIRFFGKNYGWPIAFKSFINSKVDSIIKKVTKIILKTTFFFVPSIFISEIIKNQKILRKLEK